MDVSVIFVNYNTHDFLDQCIESVIKCTKGVTYEIIIVDNNSPDRSIDETARKYKNVKLINSKVNKGFGSGCNLGVMNAAGDYVAIINPDIKIDTDVLTRMHAFMNSEKNCGLCGTVLTDEEGKAIYTYNEFPGIFWEFIQALGFGSNYFIDRLNKKMKASGSVKYEVDWLIGAFLFVRKKVYDNVKGFDENFFLYYEDVDIQLRIRDAGYGIYCLTDTSVHHYERSSVRVPESQNIYWYNMNRSKIMYMEKNLSFTKRKVILLMHIIGFISRMMVLLIRPRFRGIKKQQMKLYLQIMKLYINSFF